LWILAYWIAILVNGTFDVYLEGPPGGIWFWCVFGFGIAAVQVQRRLPARGPVEATADGNAIQLSSPAGDMALTNRALLGEANTQ
jgi:hypothetical protein